MVRRLAAFLTALLAACCGSPVLQQLLDHPRTEDAGLHTSDAAGWTDSGADSSSSSSSHEWQDSFSHEHLSTEERTRHPELSTVLGFSGWADSITGNEIWNSMVSESRSEESKNIYEDDAEYESPPSLSVHKLDTEITDEPYISLPYSDEILKYGDTSSVNGINESDTSSVKNDVELIDEMVPVANASIIGPVVGSEQFDEALGAALKDTLHKMKMVLAAGVSGKVCGKRREEEHDWCQGLSRLRVKRSDGEDSTEEENSAMDELPVNNLNDIVDLFVFIARQALEERGLDQVSIPPLERNFSRSLGVGTLRGFFRGDGGWVRRLTTLRRLGDVWLDRGPRPPSGDPRDGRSVSVATSLGLEELMVGFERYVADVRALPTVSGRLVADIDENAVLLNISFSKRDDDPKGCDVNLQHLRVLRLSGINMKLTGLGPLNWLLSRIATWLTTHSQEKVAAVVEKELIGIANKEIGRMPCDADFITALYML